MGQLRDRMEQDLILKGFAPTTRRNYLLYCRKFAAHYRRSPEELGEAEIRAFLLHTIQVEQVSYPTYRQILAALKFLYKVTLGREWEVSRLPFPKYRQSPLPRVLRDDQLLALFAALKRPKYRALFMTCYAAGLRISEACRLRIEDIDSRRMVIRVPQGKGSKERYTVLEPVQIAVQAVRSGRQLHSRSYSSMSTHSAARPGCTTVPALPPHAPAGRPAATASFNNGVRQGVSNGTLFGIRPRFHMPSPRKNCWFNSRRKGAPNVNARKRLTFNGCEVFSALSDAIEKIQTPKNSRQANDPATHRRCGKKCPPTGKLNKLLRYIFATTSPGDRIRDERHYRKQKQFQFPCFVNAFL